MNAAITSPQNPRIREAAGLRGRGNRVASGRILIDGAREVLRAVRSGLQVEAVFVCEALCRSADCRIVLDEIAKHGLERVDVGERAFEKLAFGDRAEGVVAVARAPAVELGALRLPKAPLVVVLEGVEKPGNLGAILRSADGAGANAVVVAGGGTDLFNPNAIRASLGTIFSVPVAEAPAAEVRTWLGQHGLRIVAARPDAKRLYSDADFRGPVAVALGSEAAGLSDAWSGSDVEAVQLPMLGVADSLNVSVAAAVLLYEARRQRDLS